MVPLLGGVTAAALGTMGWMTHQVLRMPSPEAPARPGMVRVDAPHTGTRGMVPQMGTRVPRRRANMTEPAPAIRAPQPPTEPFAWLEGRTGLLWEKVREMKRTGALDAWQKEIEARRNAMSETEKAGIEAYLRGLTEAKAAALLLPELEPHNAVYSTQLLGKYIEQVFRFGPEKAAEMRKNELRGLLTQLAEKPELLKDLRYSQALRVASLDYLKDDFKLDRAWRPVVHDMYVALNDCFEQAARYYPEGDPRREVLLREVDPLRSLLRFSRGYPIESNTQRRANEILEAFAATREVDVNIDAAVANALKKSLTPEEIEAMVNSTDRLIEWILKQRAGLKW